MTGGALAEVMNWGWQGVLLVLVVGGYARISRRFAAAARYRLWWGTMAAIVVMPATAIWMRRGPAEGIAPVDIAPLVELPARASLVVPVLGALWAGWTILSLARIGAALLALRRMKRTCTPFPEDLEARLTHWISVRGTRRKAALAVCPSVGSAAVLGGLAPVIAVSPAVLRHLDEEDLDQIVLHEWAHVQRHDDAAQLVQQLIRAVIGVHPAVWWTARQLQFERELACDEHVARATGSPKRYAAALARLATIVHLHRMPAVIPAAISPSQLATRVVRLVNHAPDGSARGSLAWGCVGTALVLATLGVATSLPLVAELAPRLDAAVSRPPGRPAARLDRLAAPAAEGAMMAAIATNPPTTSPGLKGRPTAPGHDTFEAPPQAVAPIAVSTDEAARRTQPPGENLSGFPETNGFSRLTGLPESASLRVPPGDRVSITTPSIRPAPNRGTPSATPWSVAADAGVAIGRGSTAAARATAGFFTRMSKSIAGGI